MKTLISFRLRKDLDTDLIAANVDESRLPDLCRDGLRLMLGIGTTRQLEVRETPIIANQANVQNRTKEKTAHSPANTGKPTVFIPNKKKD
ncbi:hypothetical protein AB4Z22_00050 [Paenibacillus sp. TAF58]